MNDAIITTLISSGMSLLIAFGTWHVSMKKDREKQTEEVKNMLTTHREEYLSGVRSVQEDITQVQSTVQNQVSLIEYEIKTLSDRVNKHNEVIERTFNLEKNTALHEEQIKNINQRIDNLEDC